MATGQGWCAKLADKEKRRVAGLRHGRYKGVLIKRATPLEGDMSEPAPEPFAWKERKFVCPMRDGFRPRQWKRKARNLRATLA